MEIAISISMSASSPCNQTLSMNSRKILKKYAIIMLESVGIKRPFFSPTSQTLSHMGRKGCEELLLAENHYRQLIDKSQSYSERIALYSEINKAIKNIKSKYCPEAKTFGFDGSLIERYRYLFENKSVLDYGCGYGQSSLLLASFSKHVTGVDASQQCIDQARRVAVMDNIRNVDFVVQSKLAINSDAKTFQACYSNDFLEHLHIEDALIHLQEVQRVLTDDGCYLCWTPGSLTGPHDITKVFYPRGVGFKSLGSHIHEYSRKELLDLADQASLSATFPDSKSDILVIFKKKYTSKP